MNTRLRAWRLLRGLSHEEAGAPVFISASYFRSIERGAVPTQEVAERFERLFGEPLDRLLKPVDIRNLPTARESIAS